MRAAAGLVTATRGRVSTPGGGRCRLPENPADFLTRERVDEELPGRRGHRGA